MEQTTCKAAIRRTKRASVSVALFALISMALMQGAVAHAAQPICNSAFDGVTPASPISKAADKTAAYAGETVTFTISWTSTGSRNAKVVDCYRVDDGSNETLNAFVTGFDEEKTVVNEGPNGTLQSVQFTITIPSDPSLVGHTIVDRAKITRGGAESRSSLVAVLVTAPPSTDPPIGGDEPPVGGDEPPVGGDEPPVGGDEPPVGGDEPPVGGDEPPVGGDEPPVGGDEPSSDQVDDDDDDVVLTPSDDSDAGSDVGAGTVKKSRVLGKNLVLAKTGVDVRVILFAGAMLVGFGIWLTRRAGTHKPCAQTEQRFDRYRPALVAMYADPRTSRAGPNRGPPDRW